MMVLLLHVDSVSEPNAVMTFAIISAPLPAARRAGMACIA